MPKGRWRTSTALVEVVGFKKSVLWGLVKTSSLTIEIIILMTRIGENPMAKYSLKDFVKVLKSMRSLRVAFDNLMEGYRCLVLVTLIIILHMYCQGVQE